MFGVLQAKLAIGKVDDPLEHEADRFADQVMRMPVPDVALTSALPQISRKCTACGEEEAKIRRKEAGAPEASLAGAPANVHEVLRSPGLQLDEATRAYFETRFGHDFSQVRVHTDRQAAASAEAIRAHAYTLGNDIVFGSGKFAPSTLTGRQLLAHELTHVVQQHIAAEQQIQRQPKNSGLSIHIKIGDATRLNKDYQWHFDTIGDSLKKQLSKQIGEAFSFLPKQFPVTVEWGQFKASDLKIAGNIQVWLIPESAPELVRPIMQLYGYSKAPIEAAVKDLGNVIEHTFDDDAKKVIGINPVEVADPVHDPLTARPVIITVPGEFSSELDPGPEFRKAHPEATPARRITQLGARALHEIGHLLGLGHAAGTIGGYDPKTRLHEQSFPPDIMDRVAPVALKEFADAKNIHLTKAELDALGGEKVVRQNSIVTKVEINPKTGEANVWIKLETLTYSKDERDIILQDLKNLVLFVQSVDAAKKKVNK